MLAISIDPGAHTIAYAVWMDKSLILVGYEADISNLAHCHLYSLVIIEKPQIYQASHSKGDPNDLIAVALTAGLCQILASEVVFYTPQQWKGQVPKKIHNQRILAALSESERARLGIYEKNHNVIDAVGIGLKHFGRI